MIRTVKFDSKRLTFPIFSPIRNKKNRLVEGNITCTRPFIRIVLVNHKRKDSTTSFSVAETYPRAQWVGSIKIQCSYGASVIHI